MDRTNEGIEVKTAQQAADIRRAAPEAPQESVVALVDQSRLRRECLRLALSDHEAGWRIVDLASAEDVLRLAEGGQKFDLLLLGAATAELVDLAQIEMLHQALPETPIVVVAENDNPHRARLILDAGPPRTSATQAPKRQNEPWSELTRRQRDVLALIAQGKSNKLIADALTMSESTVKAHVKQIIKRLHVANRTQAALLATGSLPPQSAPRAESEKPSPVAAK